MPSPHFLGLKQALESSEPYPQNLRHLYANDLVSFNSALSGRYFERKLQFRLKQARLCMSDREAEMIVATILRIEQEDIAKTRWRSQTGSLIRRAEQVSERTGRHSVFLNQVVAGKTRSIDDFFHRLVCLRLLRHTPPKFSTLQLISLALIHLGDRADEFEICGWIRQIPFNRQGFTYKALSVEVHSTLSTVYSRPHQLIKPVDPADCSGTKYVGCEDDYRGYVCYLPPGNEHEIFHVLYPVGHMTMQKFDRPFSPSQNVVKSRPDLRQQGKRFRQPGYSTELSGLPLEILCMVLQHSAPYGTTIYARNHRRATGRPGRLAHLRGALELYEVDAAQIVAEDWESDRHPSGWIARDLIRPLSLGKIMYLYRVLDPGGYLRPNFFSGNHFDLRTSQFGNENSIHGITYLPGGQLADCLPFSFLNNVGPEHGAKLKKISAEIYSDPYEEAGDRYSDQTIIFLKELVKMPDLVWVHLVVEDNGSWSRDVSHLLRALSERELSYCYIEIVRNVV